MINQTNRFTFSDKMKNKVKETPPQTTPFSHAEWAHSNLDNFRQAEDAKHRSEEVTHVFSLLIPCLPFQNKVISLSLPPYSLLELTNE